MKLLTEALVKFTCGLLTRELPGYQAYKQKVKYRLIPFIW